MLSYGRDNADNVQYSIYRGLHIAHAQNTILYSIAHVSASRFGNLIFSVQENSYYSSSLFYYRVGFKKPTKKPYSKPSTRKTSVTTMSFRSTSVRTFTSKISS